MNAVEKWIFRILGLGASVWAIGLLWLASNGTLSAATGGRDLTRIYLLGIGLLVVGGMSFFGKRWAGSLLAFGSGVLGLAMVVGSVFAVSFPWLWINLIVGFALISPSICLIVARIKAGKAK